MRTIVYNQCPKDTADLLGICSADMRAKLDKTVDGFIKDPTLTTGLNKLPEKYAIVIPIISEFCAAEGIRPAEYAEPTLATTIRANVQNNDR